MDELHLNAVADENVRKSRVLIIDDDPSFARMVREWIKDIYKADVITDGSKATIFLGKVPADNMVDLILLDYEMPGCDGPEVFGLIRREPSYAHIPIVFLTGNGSEEAIAKVMELKPDGYVIKSGSRESLLEYISTKLNEKRSN